MAYSGIAAMAASCYNLHPNNRVSIESKHFHESRTSLEAFNGEHLGLRGYSKKKLSLNRAPLSGHSNTTVQLLNLQEETKKGIEFDFNEYMVAKAMAVNEALDKAVLLRFPEKLHESMRYSLLAGEKRVRPVLCIAACELVGGTEELAMPVACAIEMIHTMTLLHDDFPSLDNNDLQRSNPRNPNAFANGTAALLVGKALHSFAFQHVVASTSKTVGSDRILRVVSELGRASGSQGVAGEHVARIMSEGAGGASVDLIETLEWIHIHKTAVLLGCSAVCGAIIGGASEDEIEKIRRYASCVGLLFHIAENIVDVTQSSQELGKTVAKDFISEKATYPNLKDLEKLKQFTAEFLDRAKGELSCFEPAKAAPLLALGEYIAFRQN